MKEYRISKKEEGIKLFAYLERVFPNAPKGILRKQLRNKNITLNKKKADGNEKLLADSLVQVFFADATIEKFSGESGAAEDFSAINPVHIDIVFEDEDIIVLSKPAGILSQKAQPQDISINEELIAYLLKRGDIKAEDLKTFKPAVCNRLDRNTSGIVLAGKTMKGLQFLSEEIREGSADKKYYALLWGSVQDKLSVKRYLTKDEKNNVSRISKEPVSEKSEYVFTESEKLSEFEVMGNKVSAVLVTLHTGKSHQIRAVFSQLGYPLLGDPKYGDREKDKVLGRKFGVKRQMLHAYRIGLSGYEEIVCGLPGDMLRVMGEHSGKAWV